VIFGLLFTPNVLCTFKIWYRYEMDTFRVYLFNKTGKSLELEQPQYFVDGRGTLQAKKGRKNFWGLVCGKWGIVFLGKKF